MRSAEGHLTDHELVAKVDRELTGTRLAAAEAHLAQCDHCRTRADTLLATALAVRVALRRGTGGDRRLAARDQLARALDRESSRHSAHTVVRWWRRARVLAPLAATTAMIVGAIILTNQPQHRASAPDVPVQARVLPIARITPGAVSALTAAQLCAGERPSRMVAPAVARKVLHAYDMEQVPADEYELDALITPELGGTVAAENLWPQRYAGGVWTAHVKDDIENYLGHLVCNGEIELTAAQQEIATDWIAAYRRHFHRDRPTHMVRAQDDKPDVIIANRSADGAPRFHLLLTAQRHQFE